MNISVCLTIDYNDSTIKGVNVSLWVSILTCAKGSETFVPSAGRKIRSGHNQHTCFATAALVPAYRWCKHLPAPLKHHPTTLPRFTQQSKFMED